MATSSLKRSWMLRIAPLMVLGLMVAIFLGAELNLYGTGLGANLWLKRSDKYSRPQLWQLTTERLERDLALVASNETAGRALEHHEREAVTAALSGLRQDHGFFWVYAASDGPVIASDPRFEAVGAAAARTGREGWRPCGASACLVASRALSGGTLLAGRELNGDFLDELMDFSANDIILWSPGGALIATGRTPQGARVTPSLPPAVLARLAQARGDELYCSVEDLGLPGYAGYEGNPKLGGGKPVVSSYVCQGSVAPEVPQRLLYVVPTPVLTTGVWYGIAGLVAAGLVVVLVLLGLLSRLLTRAIKPILALSTASAKVSQGALDVEVKVDAEAELEQLIHDFNGMVKGLRDSQAALIASERKAAVLPLQKEMEIAARIQTSILPKTLAVPGYEFVARMLPAATVGGDYYDVRAAADGGCWVGIGDVAGHGVTSGLVMLMVQSSIAALVDHHPDLGPDKVLHTVNRVIHQNVRGRLGSDEHVTLSLLRLYPDGRVAYAGAHEDLVVLRAGGSVERLETTGTWLGGTADIVPFTQLRWLTLAAGDVLMLHTDGLTEAPNQLRERLGLEAVIGAVAAARDRSLEVMRDNALDLVRRWTSSQEDDVTLMLVRFNGAAEASRSSTG